jgi:hypothetical protein
MRNRWFWFWLCAFLCVLTLVCGWIIPAHLRAVDAGVLERAGRNTTSLIQRGLALVRDQKPAPAELLRRAAQAEGFPDRETLGLAVTAASRQHSTPPAVRGLDTGAEPITEIVVRFENREKVLDHLRASPHPGVRDLLRCRALTNTVIFPPSSSSSGQPFDAALSICGLLLDGQFLDPGLSDAIAKLVSGSIRGGSSESLEQVLLDLMSLGQRFNWGQLTQFVSRIEDPETLRLLANEVRRADVQVVGQTSRLPPGRLALEPTSASGATSAAGRTPAPLREESSQLAALFAAVELSGKPLAVARYLMNFSETGLKDLGASLRFGSGGVNALLLRNQRLHVSGMRQQVTKYDPFGAFFYWTADYCWLMPWPALIFKWLLFLAAGYFIATALHFARPAVSALEQPLQVRGFHVAREVLFALGFLLVVLLLSEPFLSQDSQRVVKSSLMNQYALLTLFLFFVLQALLYTACLFKLAEIRRQRVSARIKLRLLENEDHLFDAGLYLGFAGTIISLILVSLGFIKPSLMAAYSSTSFGIIFVSVFKIFHLRPARRQLLLESEAVEPVAPASSRPLAAPL